MNFPPRLLAKATIFVGIALLLVGYGPLYKRSWENARWSSCQSNLKQIGISFLQYKRDYDDHFPPIALNSAPKGNKMWNWGGPAYGWADAIQPYAKSINILICPSVPPPNIWDYQRPDKACTTY